MRFCARKTLIPCSFVGLFCLFWESLALGASFLDIVGYDHYDSDKKVDVFKTWDNKTVTFPVDKVVGAADPAYDQTFKFLFTGTDKESGNGYSGQDRLMSLLNSVFFPEAGENDFKIREIAELSSERARAGVQTDSTGVLRSDIACLCHCYGASREHEKELIFDVEMQTTRDVNFVFRLFGYGFSLKRDYPVGKKESALVYSIGFLIHGKARNEGDLSGLGTIALRTLDGKEVQDYDVGSVKAVVIDLASQLDLIHQGPSAKILIEIEEEKGAQKRQVEIGDVGKQWFSLLGMRHYMKPSGERGRYLFPECEDLDPNIKSALTILKAYDQRDLDTVVDRNERFNSAVQSEVIIAQQQNIEKIEAQSAEIAELRTADEKKSAEIAELKRMIEELQKQNVQRNMQNLEKHGGSLESVNPLMGGQE